MISRKELIDMIATDAVENSKEPKNNCFNETKNPHYNIQNYEPPKEESDSHPIRCNIRLIRTPDGSLKWVD